MRTCPAFKQKCLKCGEKGYFKIRCPNTKVNTRGASKPFSRTVQSIEPETPNETVNNIQCAIGLDDFWIATVDSNEIKRLPPALSFTLRSHQILFDALIDTGASQNIINKSLIDNMKVEIEETKDIHIVRDITNNQVAIIEQVNLPCVFKNTIYQVTWIVTNYPLPYAILGRPGLDAICSNWRYRLITGTRYEPRKYNSKTTKVNNRSYASRYYRSRFSNGETTKRTTNLIIWHH